MATNQKLLLAIMSCVPYRTTRVAWQRETWLQNTSDPRIDVKFFYGRDVKIDNLRDDEVQLDAPDDYNNFPLKVKAMFRWSLEHGYDWVLKADDDTYGVLDRIVASVPPQGHYAGRLRGPSGNKPAPYASGFAYWTDKVARQAAVAAKWDFDIAEDRYLSNVLLAAGIQCEADYRFVVHQSKRNALSGKEGPRQNNGVVMSCEYEVKEHMMTAHDAWLNRLSDRPWHSIPEGTLSQVDILIKTFMRDGYLVQALGGLERNFRSARFVIVDDGYERSEKISRYADLRFWGHHCLWLPYDSGFGRKSNAAIPLMTRKYALIGSDDFDFSDTARRGVELMLDVMESRPDIGFCGGRVNGIPYDGCFYESDGTIVEIPTGCEVGKSGRTKNGTDYWEVDLTVNWGLIRTDLFRKGLHWCPEWKIGGDHFMFFDAIKKMGAKVAVVPNAKVMALPNVAQWKLSDYDKMRSRAWEALPGFFKHRGLKKYVMFDNSEDVLLEDRLEHRLVNGRVTHTVPVTPENSTVSCSVCGFRRQL